MSRDSELKAKRDERICARYKALADKKIGGKQMYRHEAILEMMKDEFFLTPDTIERIVSNEGKDEEPENPNQIKMEL